MVRIYSFDAYGSQGRAISPIGAQLLQRAQNSSWLGISRGGHNVRAGIGVSIYRLEALILRQSRFRGATSDLHLRSSTSASGLMPRWLAHVPDHRRRST